MPPLAQNIPTPPALASAAGHLAGAPLSTDNHRICWSSVVMLPPLKWRFPQRRLLALWRRRCLPLHRPSFLRWSAS